MSFAPPAGPPVPEVPEVPEGWTAQFDDRYEAWFYVNLATGKSQWDKPGTTPPVHASPVHAPPADSPPPYNAETSHPTALEEAGDKKKMGSNNPYNQTSGPSVSPNPMMDEDARLAAKLQAEEDARGQQGTPSAKDRGASDDYYNNIPQESGPQQPGPSYAGPSQSPMPPQEQKRGKGGFLSKLMGKGTSKLRPQQYPPQGPPPSGAYHGGGGYPPQFGHQPEYQVGYQPGYQLGYQPGYGYGPGPGYGGYPQGGFSQRPSRRQGGGMGTAGAAALGVGGGLLGGMLLADAIEDHGDHDDYGGGGGDYGGGDFDGGADFGGDF